MKLICFKNILIMFYRFYTILTYHKSFNYLKELQTLNFGGSLFIYLEVPIVTLSENFICLAQDGMKFKILRTHLETPIMVKAQFLIAFTFRYLPVGMGISE